jgi:hypothetical protein
MNKYFHEAKLAVTKSRKEWTESGSLDQMTTYSINHACETAIRGLWVFATNEEFPREQIGPHHKPLSLLRHVGILDCYSVENRKFLEVINGMSLDDVRYIESSAYQTYIKPKNMKKGEMLVDGIEKFIYETIQLSENETVVEKIQHKNIELKKSSS